MDDNIDLPITNINELKIKLKQLTKLDDDTIKTVLESIIEWLKVGPRKCDEMRLGLVRMAYVHAYGDSAEIAEPFRDALIHVITNGIELTSWSDALDIKKIDFAINYNKVKRRLNDIEAGKIDKNNVGLGDLNKVCKFGTNCSWPTCIKVHHGQWSPEVAKENKTKWEKRQWKNKVTEEQKKKNRKGKKDKE
eukprot:396964_1